MKLSTAIRIGSMTTKQVILSGNDGQNGRCALGAAVDALGVTPQSGVIGQAVELFPILQGTYQSLRMGKFRFGMALAITSMNDCMGWSREQIADWVEKIEQLQDRREQRKAFAQHGLKETVTVK